MQESNKLTDRIDFGLFLLVFIGMNPINTFGVSDMGLIVVSLLNTYYIIIYRKQKLDSIIFYVLLYWAMVNVLSYMVLDGGRHAEEFQLASFIGSCLKIYIGYSLIKITGARIISWFEKTVVILAIISVPFFILQLVNPSVFYNIPFNLAESYRITMGHWNGLIFNYSTYHVTQNSGFAGEPGTFGYYLGMAMIFNLILHEGKFNRNFLILMLVGLTTMSTNYYATLLLFGLYFMNNSPVVVKIIYGVLSLFVMYFVYQLPFVGNKIEMYIEDTESFASSNLVRTQRINRLATLVNNLTDVMHYPFGYGLNDAERTTNIFGYVIDGTNGISRIAVRFGLFGMVYFLTIYYRMIKMITLQQPGHVLFFIIMTMYIMANPMERDYLAMGIFWLYFIIDQEDVEDLVTSRISQSSNELISN